VISSTSTDRDSYDLLVYRKGNETIVEDEDEDIIIQETDSTAAIQSGVRSLPSEGIMLISGGKYKMTDTLKLTPDISVKGTSDTILDFSSIGNKNATIEMARGSTLSDITISGPKNQKEFPRDFTQKLKAADDVVIERVIIQDLAYGIETADTADATLIDIVCKNIHSTNDWGACIHAGGVKTTDLSVDGFEATNSNRGVEIDAPASDIVVENGHLESIKNYAGTGQTAFSIDVHSHEDEGSNSDITYRNIYLNNSDAPSAYAVGSQNYQISDQPQDILFENITVENPATPWYVNAQGIIIKNSRVIDSKENVMVIIKNSKDVTIDSLEANALHSDKYFISNSEYHTGSKAIQTGIEDVEVSNSNVTVSPNKSGDGAVMSFRSINELTLSNNEVINAKHNPAISLEGVSGLVEENNRVTYID
jgi:hypothetical protein